MSEKIQTEFTNDVVRKVQRLIAQGDDDGYRPPDCKFRTRCFPITYAVQRDDSYHCCGVVDTDDEDILTFCLKNSAGHKPIWCRHTIQEALDHIEALSHTVRTCMGYGMPDYNQVMHNWVQEIKDWDNGITNNFGRVLRNRSQ